MTPELFTLAPAANDFLGCTAQGNTCPNNDACCTSCCIIGFCSDESDCAGSCVATDAHFNVCTANDDCCDSCCLENACQKSIKCVAPWIIWTVAISGILILVCLIVCITCCCMKRRNSYKETLYKPV